MSAPHTPFWVSLQPERVEAVHAFGFTERQAQFLTHVLLFSGVFLERQYCHFSNIAHGQKSHDFIERLIAHGYATPITPGSVRRGRMYHVQHKALYAAIGDYMRLVKDRILYIWEQRRAEAKDRTAEQEKRVKAIQLKLDRLDEAFLFQQSIDAKSYERQRDRLREELTLAQIDITSMPSTNSTYRASWRSQNAFCRARQTCGCKRRSTTSSDCSSCSSRKGSRTTEIDSIEPP